MVGKAPLPPPAPNPEEDFLKDLAAKGENAMDAGGADVGCPIPVEGEDLEAWAMGMVDMLTEGHKELCLKVKETGLGVCSRCRWSSGCAPCDFAKAVRYYRD